MQINAKSRLDAATEVTAAQHANVEFKDGSVHKVSYYADPGKRRGNFMLKTPGLPSLVFNKDSGRYIAYTYNVRRDGPDPESAFKTGTSDAKEAYLKGIKKFWKAL